MKKLAFLLMLNLATTSFASIGTMGTHCGPRGSFWGTLASEIVIPDYFPPENFLARFVLFGFSSVDIASCEEMYEPVHLGESCEQHDSCYSTLGALKEDCDQDLLKGWLNSCAQRYDDGSQIGNACLDACNSASEFMHNTMRYDDGNSCPSCEAFANAQELAQTN